MRFISDTPVTSRFLLLAHRLSPIACRNECNSVTEWLAIAPDTITEREREMLTIIQQPLQPTEHPLVAVYCYAHIPEGTKWDIAFNSKDTTAYEYTAAFLRFGIIWQRIVSRSLSDGWHQVAVIDFPNGIPHLIEALPVDPEVENYNYKCLCSSADFPEIQRHMTTGA